MSAKKYLLFILVLFMSQLTATGSMMLMKYHLSKTLSLKETLTLEKVCKLSEGNRNVVVVLIDSLYEQDSKNKKTTKTKRK